MNTKQITADYSVEEKPTVHVHVAPFIAPQEHPFHGVEVRMLSMQNEPTEGNEQRWRLIFKNETGADKKPLEGRFSSSKIKHVQSAVYRENERGIFLPHRGWVAIGTLDAEGNPVVDMTIAFSPLFKVETPASTWLVPIVSSRSAWTFKAEGNKVIEDVTRTQPVWAKFTEMTDNDIFAQFARQKGHSLDNVLEWISNSGI